MPVELEATSCGTRILGKPAGKFLGNISLS
jgi:hypothetical protein